VSTGTTSLVTRFCRPGWGPRSRGETAPTASLRDVMMDTR
jgi:hypothetical protein